LNRGRHLY